jgi:TPR repeat protein
VSPCLLAKGKTVGFATQLWIEKVARETDGEVTMAPYRVVEPFLAVALLFLSAGSASAGFDDGFAAYERGDYDTAFREFMPLALVGDASAQFYVGVMYAHGEGVPQDDAEAVRWFRPAADHGVAEAQFNLGLAYDNGWGVLQNEVLAYMWFNLAAARSPQGGEVRERAVAKRGEVAGRLSPAQRALGEELERNWRPGVAARPEGVALAYGDTGKG